MKQSILLILLPVLSYAQDHLSEKLVDGQHLDKRNSVYVYTAVRNINTTIFFPKPPKISGLENTTSPSPEFTIRVCLTNLKSLNDVRLTVNGEVQAAPAQTTAEFNTCKGLQYSCVITLPLPTNTISLEARNEGGASIHYAVVTVKP